MRNFHEIQNKKIINAKDEREIPLIVFEELLVCSTAIISSELLKCCLFSKIMEIIHPGHLPYQGWKKFYKKFHSMQSLFSLFFKQKTTSIPRTTEDYRGLQRTWNGNNRWGTIDHTFSLLMITMVGMVIQEQITGPLQHMERMFAELLVQKVIMVLV